MAKGSSNPVLPPEIKGFAEANAPSLPARSLRQYEALHETELKDVNQQIKMRPYVAGFFGALLVVQNMFVFALVWWALDNDKLGELQWVFSALVAASLTETYTISRLIVNKLFEPIDYKDKHERFTISK